MKVARDSSFLPRMSVRRPVTVVMVFVALLVVGYIAYTRIPLEMLPAGFDPPFMAVIVPYPNATPEEIEDQITRPIEEIIGTVRNVRQVRSRITNNSTFVRIEFNQGTDMELAYAELRDRMERVKVQLPNDVERIFVRRAGVGDLPFIVIVLEVMEEVPDLYYLVDRNIVQKLNRIDGVANIEFGGVEEKSFQIDLEMDKISAHKINVYELVREMQGANLTLPGGFVREGSSRLYIRAMGKFRTIDEIKQIEVRPGVLLGDIATITFSEPRRQSIETFNGNQAAFVQIFQDAGANTVDVHNAVVAAIEREFSENPNLGKLKHEILFSQGQIIVDSITDLQETAIWAAVFAVLVLYFFLRHVRLTLVITLAIPISILSTIVVMYFTGETLNLLTLMGLMICVGLVVDNSVVVVENIFRHRRAGDKPDRAAIKGASEVGLAVVMATLTTIVVFLPLILMTGSDAMAWLMGRIGFPVIFGLLSSLLVALVFIPLTTTFIKDKGKLGSSKLIDWTRERYVGALQWALGHRVEMVILSVIILVVVFMLTSDLGFQGELRGTLSTDIRLRLGKRYYDVEDYPAKLADRVMRWCEDNQGFLQYDSSMVDIGPEMVDIELFRDTAEDRTPLLEKPLLWAKNMLSQQDMQKDPERERRMFIKENLPKDLGLIKGEAEIFVGYGVDENDRGQVQLVLEGPDYDELRRWGERVRSELVTLPDILNVETDIEMGRDELAIRIDRDLARSANVATPVAVQTIGNSLRGVQLPRFQDREREIRIQMGLREEDRQDIDDFKNLRIPTIDGKEVPLSTIATFEYTRGPATITHINRKPNFNLLVTGKIERLDRLMPIVAGAMRRLGNGQEYTYRFGDRAIQMMESADSFLYAALLAVTFVFILMGVLFESFALPLTIIACIPFALAGSNLLLKLYGMPANLFAYIGIVIIIGVVVNNGIVLVDLINRQRAKGMDRTQAISLAGHYRFRPILMTAGTTIFSLIPMAFGDANLISIPYNPLGMAMIGGLALNSIVTLFMVPVFYTIFDDLKKVWYWLTNLFVGRREAALAGAKAGSRK
jgi:HAE1 family hydrophobic/amphiphilic exporter-1